MITIYQIKLTEDQIARVNAEGHDSVTAQSVRLKMMFGFDQSNFSEDYLQYYSKSWEINTDDLDEAFEVSNGMGDPYKGTRIGRASSGSVGDIFVNDEGDCFIVDNFGFVAVGYYDMKAA